VRLGNNCEATVVRRADQHRLYAYIVKTLSEHKLRKSRKKCDNKTFKRHAALLLSYTSLCPQCMLKPKKSTPGNAVSRLSRVM
jgi:hypothetical protein